MLTVALRETMFEYQYDSKQISISGKIRLSRFRCREKMDCLSIKISFTNMKLSIDPLMDELQPVILEYKRFNSQEKLETSAFSRL